MAGAATPGYDPVQGAISDLAATGASTRLVMTSGMVLLGAGLCADAWAVRATVADRTWLALFVSGLAAFGVAAVPLGWFSDGLHGAFAGVGYVTLAVVPAMAARSMRAAGESRAAWAAVAASAVCGLCLLATVAGSAHGLFQRAGLLAGHTWVVWFAWRTLRDPRATGAPLP